MHLIFSNTPFFNNMPSRSNLSFAAPAYNPDPTFQTALDQASTPGLTLTQRFHRLLESVDIPNLTRAPQSPSSQLADAHTKMLALQAFKQTPHYQSFKNCVARTLTELDRIANSSRPANQHNTNFQNLGDGLWEAVTLNSTSRFGAFQADLYQQACPDANRLVRMHTFAQQLPHLVAGGGEDNARACIKDLSERLDVCGPGLVQYFDEAVNSVRQTTFTPSLPERFEALRIQIARNTIAEFVNQQPDSMGHAVANEVHKVAAWQNLFSHRLHLPFIDDVFASPSYAENRIYQKQLFKTLADLQTPSAIATVMATQILEEAHDLWRQAQAGGETDLTRHCMALVEKLGNRHGAVEPHTLFEMDEDGMPFGLHTNPTLLALSLVRQTERSSEVHTQPESLWEWSPSITDQQGAMSIRSIGSLRWLETTPPPGVAGATEQQLLSTTHMSPRQAQVFFDSASTPQLNSIQMKAAMHELLRNDWGARLPHCKSQDFDPYIPNDVFVNLAMGLTQGLALGQVNTQPKYRNVLSKALENLTCSTALKHYTPDQIGKLLNTFHQWNLSPSGKNNPLDVYKVVNTIIYLRQNNPNIPLYKAALEFNWAQQRGRPVSVAFGNVALCSPNREVGLAHIDAMAKHAPQLLTDTLCRNIPLIQCPELVTRFLDAGALLTAPNTGQQSALQRLLRNPNDAFITNVLHNLADRGVSLQELADPGIVSYLLSHNKVQAAHFLHSRIAQNA